MHIDNHVEIRSIKAVYDVSDIGGRPIIQRHKLVALTEGQDDPGTRAAALQIMNYHNIKGVPTVHSLIYTQHPNPDNSIRTVNIEQVNGQNLAETLRQRVISSQELATILVQLCRIVQDLTKLGITHNDIKLSNIMLNAETNKITLVDFGLASIYGQPTMINGQWYNYIPRENIGTPEYMAPEKTKENKANMIEGGRAEIFSIATLAIKIATRDQFSHLINKYELIERLTLKNWNKKVLTPAETDLLKLLHKNISTDPNLRTTSITMLYRQLQHISKQLVSD